MNRAERIGLLVLGIGTIAALLFMTLLKVTVFSTMSNVAVFAPLGVPVMVVYGLVFGRLWDRLLRGKNVTLPKPKKTDGNDPYRPSGGATAAAFGWLGALFVSGSIVASGCASGYRASYGAGAITKELVTQSHSIYSSELNDQFNVCDPRLNPASEVRTWEEFQECMGPDYTREHAELAVKLLTAYRAAAATLSAVLLQADPSKEDLDKAWKDAFDAAVAFLVVLPGGADHVEKLRALLGRMAG